jgi:hypothetical protein
VKAQAQLHSKMVGLRKFKPMGRDGAANLTRLLLKSHSTAQTK